MECPFCHESVEPLRTSRGLVCPRCGNAGAATKRSRSAPLATASMIVGIIAVAIPVFGLVPGVVAVALSHRVEHRILHGASVVGRRRATAGLVLGLVAVSLNLLLALFIIGDIN